MTEGTERGRILDGSATAKTLRREITEGTTLLKQQTGRVPHLAAVLIGDNPASETYVAMKQKTCAKAGIVSSLHRLPSSAAQQQAEELVKKLNSQPDITGILVQHPLPSHLHEQAVLDCVSLEKDVDGISGNSLGRLISAEPAHPSCTPAGIIELLKRYNIPLQGKHAVVVGRSIILGKPVALMLLNRHCTVTICHSRTPDLAEYTRQADILVAAVGKPEMITQHMIKPGAVVIDAGYNRVEGRNGDVGDVHYEGAAKQAAWVTPVPGGVGPMTIAMLLRNTLLAAQGRFAE